MPPLRGTLRSSRLAVGECAGKDSSHRKQWVIERLAQLAQMFSIEICAYAVMSNHYPVVLYVNREHAAASP